MNATATPKKVSDVPFSPAEALLSVKEAAAILNISPKTVQRFCKSGQLGYVPITPTLFRIRRAALDRFIAKREVRAA